MKRILGLFALSGALGLGYQVLWSKLVLLFVGVSSWSYAVVLAAFMCGLAIGSRLFGRVADRMDSPLRLFAFLELGVGLYAIAYMPLAGAAAHLYARLVVVTPHGSGGMHGLAAKALVAGLLLLPPTILMGGTFPALVRHATRSLDVVGRRASQLYAVNAAGAVIGTLLMAFVLMPQLGITASLMLLALGNACVGVSALVLARRDVARRSTETTASVQVPAEAAAAAGGPDIILVGLGLVFIAGFLSFTLEVAWTRMFSVAMGSSTYSFAAILAAFITGIAVGSALLSRIESRITRPVAFFGWTQIATALLVLLPLPICAYMPWAIGALSKRLPATTGGYGAYEAIKLSACLLVMLPPAIFIGLSIPLIVKATSKSIERLGRDTGAVYAWNTAGNVLGALVAGLVLLPALGVQVLIRAACVVAALVGLAGVSVGVPSEGRRRSIMLAAAPVGVVLLIAALLPRWDAAWFTLTPFRRHGSVSFGESRDIVRGRKIILDRDDPAANVLVMGSRNDTEKGIILFVNGKPDASSFGDAPTQLLSAHVPLLLHPNPKAVLVIGLASGMTSGAALQYPIDRLDIVDIVQSMPQAAAFFDAYNGRPLEDPRTTFIADDARSFLSTTTAKYDVIISEPSNPWTAGTGSLFSTEFYERAATHLTRGGMYVQWIQGYEVGDALLAAMVRSYRQAFPHVSWYAVAPGDTLLIGSNEPIVPDVALMDQRMQAPGVREQLSGVKIHRAGDLLYLQQFASVSIDWIASLADAENTDDNLLLEYRAPRDLFLRRRPQGLPALDERFVAAPSLAWTREVQRLSAATGAWDPEPLARMVSGRPFADAHLLEALLTAWARTSGRPIGEVVASMGGKLVKDPLIAIPATQDELVASLEDAVTRRDDNAVGAIIAKEHTAIVDASLISRDAATAWSTELGSLIARSSGATATRLRLLLVDVLAATGQGEQALAMLHAALASAAPPSVEAAMLAACRVDDGAPCTALAQELLAATGDARLERFLALRSAGNR